MDQSWMDQSWMDQSWMDQSQINQTWADRFFAEPRGPASSAERDGSDGVAPPSRPSNDPGHASKCEHQETADALQPCSSMILKLAPASQQPTALQQSLRRAWGRSIQNHWNRATGPASGRDWAGLAGKFATELEMLCGAPQATTPQWNQRLPGRPNGACDLRTRGAAALRATADASRVPSNRAINLPRITSRLLGGSRFGWLAENPAAAFAQTGALSVHAGRDPFHVGNFR